MLIENILEQITPERIKKEIEATKKVELPPQLKIWIEEYEKVGKRDEFVWKLFLKARQSIDCVSLPEINKEALQEVDFLMALFVVLFDDVADNSQNEELLNEMMKIIIAEDLVKFNGFNQEEKDSLFFTVKVWQRINQLITKSPGYEEFKDVFKYDIRQVINAINHDYIINKNLFMINKTDYWLYSPHTMQFVFNVTVNLMYLESFDMKELKTIREIIWQSQKMARVGNCIGTWEREVNESDFTSGIFAYALDSKILSVQDLIEKDTSEIIKKIKKSDIERELLNEWVECHKKIFYFSKDEGNKTIDVKKLLLGMENILLLELISKKYK